MFVRKNLLQQSHMIRRNGVLKGLALFFLWASAVLLFSSADLILNPNISNSFVYLQKMFLSPSWTNNTTSTISFDGLSWGIRSNTLLSTDISATNINTLVFTASVASITDSINTPKICKWSDCFDPSSVSSLVENLPIELSAFSGRLATLEQLVQSLSGVVSNL